MSTRLLLSHQTNLSHHHAHISKQGPFAVNMLLCVFSCGKTIFDFKILLNNEDYPIMLNIWLLLSIIYDIINVLLPLVLLLEMSYRSQTEEDLEDDREGSNDVLNIKGVTRFIIFINCYYYVLFVLNFCLWLYSYFESFTTYSLIYTLIFLNVYCGLLYIGFCLIQVIVTKDFSRMVTFSFFEFGKSQTVPTQNVPISLPVKFYTPEMESNECYICLMTYNKGDKINELPCNPKHYFHEACIKKWFKLRTFCPLCRKSIKGDTKDLVINDVELQIIES